MGAPKGHKAYAGGGRPRGSLNKGTKAEAACERAGIDPFDLLVKHAISGDIGAVVQLCKHIEPPKRALEVAVDPDKNEIKIVIERYGNTDKAPT